jgi:alginate O-acetyltransferase complex protein AlgI
MVFSSSIFLFLFLPVVIVAHFLVPRDWRNLLLLVASLLFYAWGEGFYVLIMLASIVFNYGFGVLLDPARQVRFRRIGIWMAVMFNLAILGWFKYANFFIENLNFLLEGFRLGSVELEPVHLPIGISFFTFQAISYVVDVYRGRARAQGSLINTALYISLFPQLIAGPIVRYHHIALQISRRVCNLDGFSSGMTRFCIGLAKKMLLANPLGAVADQVFAIPAEGLTFGVAWLGIVCYGLQIYFDFSGYSDMAIGLGRMFGFRFLVNFRYPYTALSVRDFWRRWHISLSRWFRDYVYIPLGGNRLPPWRVSSNLLLVFVLCGLWHGASWNFLVWGLVHGFFLALERTWFGERLFQMPRVIRHMYLLGVVVFAWVFFRSDSLSYAISFINAMTGLGGGDSLVYHTGLYWTREVMLVLVVAVIAATPVFPRILRRLFLAPGIRAGQLFSAHPSLQVLWSTFGIAALALILLASGMNLAAGTFNPFIYFRF